jgi:hypothetical protein
MKHLFEVTLGILLLAGNFLVQGQFRAPGGLPAGFHHALLDVLAEEPSFYGQATILLSNGPDKEPTSMSCSIAGLSGSLRLELDSFETGSNVPPAEAAQLRNMHSVTILRPDKNRMYMEFPGFNSFVEIAYSKSTGTEPALPAKITKTVLGKEIVEDQQCQKSQWNIAESDGEQYNAIVWESTNWNNFPIQIKIGSPAAVVEFQELHLEAPNSSLFDLPANYIKYEGIQQNIERQLAKGQTNNAP